MKIQFPEGLKGDEVLIRIENKTPFKFKNVLVNTTGEDQLFGTIKSGSTSSYKLFKSAYRYAFVELKINGNIFTIQPIDYVGESLLLSGKYTYQLEILPPLQRYGSLSITLRQD